MKINNPYIEEIREIYIILDKNPDKELEKKLFELEEKSRAFTQENLEGLRSNTFVVEEKMTEVKQDKSQYPSLSKQYKEACVVYREIMELVDQIRALKKSLREEIEFKRCKNGKSKEE